MPILLYARLGKWLLAVFHYFFTAPLPGGRVLFSMHIDQITLFHRYAADGVTGRFGGEK
jgi:hypothetical protein